MKEFLLYKSNGEITNRQILDRALEDMVDGRHLIKITNKNKRSISQNAFYWLLLTDYIQPGLYNIGYREIKTKDDAHSFCTNEFLKKQVVNHDTGEIKTHVRSTSELTTVEWEEYRETLNQFASEYLGIVLPDPGQQIKMDYEPNYNHT